MAKQALVNVAQRADQTRYHVAPVEFTDSDGNTLTVAASATDTTTAIALGIVASA